MNIFKEVKSNMINIEKFYDRSFTNTENKKVSKKKTFEEKLMGFMGDLMVDEEIDEITKNPNFLTQKESEILEKMFQDEYPVEASEEDDTEEVEEVEDDNEEVDLDMKPEEELSESNQKIFLKIINEKVDDIINDITNFILEENDRITSDMFYSWTQGSSYNQYIFTDKKIISKYLNVINKLKENNRPKTLNKLISKMYNEKYNLLPQSQKNDMINHILNEMVMNKPKLLYLIRSGEYKDSSSFIGKVYDKFVDYYLDGNPEKFEDSDIIFNWSNYLKDLSSGNLVAESLLNDSSMLKEKDFTQLPAELAQMVMQKKKKLDLQTMKRFLLKNEETREYNDKLGKNVLDKILNNHISKIQKSSDSDLPKLMSDLLDDLDEALTVQIKKDKNS